MKTIIACVAAAAGVITAAQFMYVLPIHATVAVLTILTVVAADLIGLRWILGRGQIPQKTTKILHAIIYVGLTTMIVSGAIMFWGMSDYLLESPAFLLKMIMVFALVVNSYFIHRHMHIAMETEFKNLSTKEKIHMFVSAGVSTTAWVGSYILAQLLF